MYCKKGLDEVGDDPSSNDSSNTMIEHSQVNARAIIDDLPNRTQRSTILPLDYS
jgi:hypothetical protein